MSIAFAPSSGITRFSRKKLSMSPALSPWRPSTTLPRKRCVDRQEPPDVKVLAVNSACFSARLQYLYAFNIVPMKVMDPSELVKQPQDVTAKPFGPSADANRQKSGFSAAAKEVTAGRWSSRETRRRASSLTFQPTLLPVQEPAQQFFFDLDRKQGGGRGRKRPSEGEGRGRQQHHDGDGHHRGQPKQPRRPRESLDQCVWTIANLTFGINADFFPVLLWVQLSLLAPAGSVWPALRWRNTWSSASGHT